MTNFSKFSESSLRPARRRYQRLGFWVLLSLLLSALLSNNTYARDPSSAARRLAALSEDVQEDYPGVRHISVTELKQDFADALLVDVRRLEEYETSHLPGAVHAPEPEDIDRLRAQYPNTPMVMYCTVGVRSAVAVRDLLARDPSQQKPPVVNLAGSIFAWANSGEPLEDASGPTSRVHPYNAWWGWRYLDNNRPRPEPTGPRNPE